MYVNNSVKKKIFDSFLLFTDRMGEQFFAVILQKEPVNVDDLPSCIQRGVQEGNSVEYGK